TGSGSSKDEVNNLPSAMHHMPASNSVPVSAYNPAGLLVAAAAVADGSSKIRLPIQARLLLLPLPSVISRPRVSLQNMGLGLDLTASLNDGLRHIPPALQTIPQDQADDDDQDDDEEEEDDDEEEQDDSVGNPVSTMPVDTDVSAVAAIAAASGALSSVPDSNTSGGRGRGRGRGRGGGGRGSRGGRIGRLPKLPMHVAAVGVNENGVIKVIKPNKPFKCSLCGKSYKKKKGLIRHAGLAHPGADVPIVKNPAVLNVIRQVAALGAPEDEGGEERPYICTLPGCDKRYKNPNGLSTFQIFDGFCISPSHSYYF
ncbi:hypothetical protein HK405_015824, partial [Cladochytrium tenue]